MITSRFHDSESMICCGHSLLVGSDWDVKIVSEGFQMLLLPARKYEWTDKQYFHEFIVQD